MPEILDTRNKSKWKYNRFCKTDDKFLPSCAHLNWQQKPITNCLYQMIQTD